MPLNLKSASRTSKKGDALGGLVKLNFGRRITEKKVIKTLLSLVWCECALPVYFVIYVNVSLWVSEILFLASKKMYNKFHSVGFIFSVVMGQQ